MEVHRTIKGYAEYMWADGQGIQFYCITYFELGKAKLWTNSMSIVKDKLNPKTKQLLLF